MQVTLANYKWIQKLGVLQSRSTSILTSCLMSAPSKRFLSTPAKKDNWKLRTSTTPKFNTIRITITSIHKLSSTMTNSEIRFLWLTSSLILLLNPSSTIINSPTSIQSSTHSTSQKKWRLLSRSTFLYKTITTTSGPWRVKRKSSDLQKPHSKKPRIF